MFKSRSPKKEECIMPMRCIKPSIDAERASDTPKIEKRIGIVGHGIPINIGLSPIAPQRMYRPHKYVPKEPILHSTCSSNIDIKPKRGILFTDSAGDVFIYPTIDQVAFIKKAVNGINSPKSPKEDPKKVLSILETAYRGIFNNYLNHPKQFNLIVTKSDETVLKQVNDTLIHAGFKSEYVIYKSHAELIIKW